MTSASGLVGVGPLLRASLRHEIRTFVPWILIPVALSVSSVVVYPLLFPDLTERMTFATTIGANPALGLIFGPAHDLAAVDGFNAWRSLALGGFAVALGAILIVVRASRGQEDSGQAELLAAGVLGRQSRLVTAVGLGVAMSVGAGTVTAVASALCGGSWSASSILGAGFAATGVMFVGVAAVAAQIGADARTASSIGVSVLGVLFALRGFAYSVDAPSWTTWVNPLGWVTETRPASGDHWLPLAYCVALAAGLVAVAIALQSFRDFGQGLVAARPGPARGSLTSPLSLTLRLGRASAIAWTIAFAGLGVIFGYFTGSVRDVLGSNPALTEIFAAGASSPEDLTSSFVVTILGLAGTIASVSGVQTVNRLRTEELEDRAEPVLSTSVDRVRYLGAYIVVALLVPTVCTVVAGVVIGGFTAFTDIGLNFHDVLLQAVATVPAVWTVVALSVAVIGARPRERIASWAGALLSFALTLLGPSFKLPDWALAFSPFWHVPNVAADSPHWVGLVWITLVTAALLTVGLAAFRHRDSP